MPLRGPAIGDCAQVQDYSLLKVFLFQPLDGRRGFCGWMVMGERQEPIRFRCG